MSTILSRQNLNDPNLNDPNNTSPTGNNDVPFWWTRTGQIVRWAVFLGILTLIFVFLIISYCHARRRINKGHAPLSYHRWMLSRQERERYDPTYRDQTTYYYPYQGNGYNMHPMPPPVYDPGAPMPPVYQPPAGATKIDPSQWRSGPTTRPAAGADSSPSYEAPPGPPPAAVVHTNHTGASSVSNNPYRV